MNKHMLIRVRSQLMRLSFGSRNSWKKVEGGEYGGERSRFEVILYRIIIFTV